MRKASAILIILNFSVVSIILGQTTVTSGNWTDSGVWSGGTVPGSGSTATINHPLTIDQSLSLSGSGNYTFNANATDNPGGSAYSLTLNASTGAFTVNAGATVTLEGTGTMIDGTLDIYGTLILGATEVRNSATMDVYIESGGTLIINGDLILKNNSGDFIVDGSLIVYGNIDVQSGTVSVSGGGTIYASGTITSGGSSTIFGYPNDCTSGPCSGSTLSCSFTNSVSPTSQVLCSGSTAGVFTASTNGSSPTYLWESSTTSSTSGFANAAGTNTNSTYSSPSGLTQTTWYRVAITSGGCTSRSAAVKVTVLSGGGWKGVTSDWGTSSNWCSNSVPTNATDVVINSFPSGSGLFMPVIASGTNGATHNLTINSGASVTINNGGTLSLTGDFTNNGTFTDNSNTTNGVTFNGTSTQTISGGTPNTFNNLTINNTSGSTPGVNVTSNNVDVKSTLSLNSGIVNLNGYTLTLGLSDLNTGTLSHSGNTRFYNGNFNRWLSYSTTTMGTAAGLFPVGSSADYRPLYLGNGGLSSGGTVKVNHTAISGSTVITPFSDNGGNVVLRSNSYWTVYTGNGLGTGTFSLRTEGTGFGTVGDVNDLRITLVNSIAPGSDGAHAGTTTNPQVNRTGLTTGNLVNSFYWGSINGTQTPLPVSVLYFKGKFINDVTQLEWATAKEKDFAYFTIERALPDLKFIPVGEVQAGQGDSDVRRIYKFTDELPLPGLSYYRLKSTDVNGSFEYHGIVAIHNNGIEDLLRIYPNPVAGDVVYLNYSATQPAGLKVISMLGDEVYEGYINPGRNIIDFKRNLNPGIYVIRVTGQQPVKALRLIVR